MAITLGAGVVLTGGGIQVGVPLNAPIITDARALSTNSTVVSFIPPVNSTGQAVSRYTITSLPGTTQNTGTITTATYNYTGLTQGASYTYTINAYSAFDTSLPAIVTLTTWDVPQPPTNLTASISSVTNAVVAFTPPVNFGGTPIFQYRVTSSPGGLTSTGTASPITISGLTTGTSYTFTANATNIVGTSTSSQASNSVTAAAVPGAPTIGTASSINNSSVSVAFTAPASNGGSAVTSYIAVSSPGNISSTGTTSPITVSGLTSGTSYTFTVAAINSIGTGAYSTASNTVVPTPSLYASATGGNITLTGLYKIHTFTSSNVLSFSNGGNIQYLVVGGGGAGGTLNCTNQYGGGGGAGGLLAGCISAVPGCVNFTVTVGAGGTSNPQQYSGAGNFKGCNSSLVQSGLSVNVLAYGGGRGGLGVGTLCGCGSGGGYGGNGGSGGGAGRARTGGCHGGKGVYPGSTYISAPRQGYDGADYGGGGSGGAATSYPGGPGTVSTITGVSITYAVGGSGLGCNTAGAANSGTGGGGGNNGCLFFRGGFGGSGVVIVRYQYTAGTTGTPFSVCARVGGPTTATVYFTPPLNAASLTITNYIALSSPGGITSTGSTSPILVSGLSGNTTYTFTVAAVTALGTGTYSAASLPITTPVQPPIGPLFVMGCNSSGQLGLNNATAYSSPKQVGASTNWYSIAGGQAHTSAVDYSGKLWAWGDNARGQLGQNNTTVKSSPTQVGSLTNWKKVYSSALDQTTVALKNDNTLWVWGINNNGQLGRGISTYYSSPVQLGALTNWLNIAAGRYFMGAVKTDGTLWTWGYNGLGGLGLGDTTNRSSPVQVGTLTNWKNISAGNYHMAAVKTDGTLWTWGYNALAELGTGNLTNYSSPKQIGALTNWSITVSGAFHVIALKTDGTLWSWGRNAAGEPGLGNATTYSSPKQIGSLTSWTSNIAVGRQHNLAIDTSGKLYAWGLDTSGQLGNNSSTNLSSPVQIGSLTSWLAVAAGQYHSVIIHS